jgi:AcrR family transcriptional regulator
MSLRAFKKAATREALISAARKLFAEKGYENTTLEEICEQVPIHVTTFFSYFDSKEELAFARTIEAVRSFCTQLRDRPPEADVMTTWWTFFYSYGLRDREEESALMLRMEEVPALRNRYASILRQYEEEVARALAEEAGRDPDTDLYAKIYASTLLGTIVAGAHWHRAIHGPDPITADTAAVTKLVLSRFPGRAEVEAALKQMTPQTSSGAAARSRADATTRAPRKKRTRG